jgi:hypothetical protein
MLSTLELAFLIVCVRHRKCLHTHGPTDVIVSKMRASMTLCVVLLPSRAALVQLRAALVPCTRASTRHNVLAAMFIVIYLYIQQCEFLGSSCSPTSAALQPSVLFPKVKNGVLYEIEHK